MLLSFHCRLEADEESLISFVAALAGPREFSSGRFAEDNPTSPRGTLIGSAWHGLRNARRRSRSQRSDHWRPLSDS